MSSHNHSTLGIDIGGANLKYAAPVDLDRNRHCPVPRGIVRSRFFPMWRRHQELCVEIGKDLRSIVANLSINAVAVTMTGELADCFADRAEGVEHIVAHACEAVAEAGIPQVKFYGVDGVFHNRDDATKSPDRIAAANWHALANFVARSICHSGVLVDVGSTTTDIIPLLDGRVATGAKNDHDRLVEGSLVYIGGGRTPVAALVSEVVHRGQRVSIMNEWFATMDDVRLVLGLASENPEDCDTADGRPRVFDMAVNRLARMIGLDHRHFTSGDAREMAGQVHEAVRDRIAEKIERVRAQCGGSREIVISGHARDLIDVAPDVATLDLGQWLGQEMSRSATALAVASLYDDAFKGSPVSCGE